MKKAVIFDIDGTLADITHRLHYIKCANPDWEEFNLACVHDRPKDSIIELLRIFKNTFYTIILVSGRPEYIRDLTMTWLKANDIHFDELLMRQTGSLMSDFLIKEKLLIEKILPRYDVRMVVDDRESVVAMWRKNGLTCFQCQKGNY